MSTFADAFRELVMPDLKKSCSMQALQVVRGVYSFGEAHANVWSDAAARGATHLPLQLIADLDGWIDTTILRTINAIETIPGTRKEIVDEALAPLEDGWRTIP